MTATKPAKDVGSPAALLRKLANYEGQIDAMRRTHAVLELEMDGTVLDANALFLDALGYTMDATRGRHHRMFVDPAYASSRDYARFWSALNQGKLQGAVYKRIGKAGNEVWFQATYTPVRGDDGALLKVVNHSTHFTGTTPDSADGPGQREAEDGGQAVIEFALDGTVLTANDRFLAVLGYSLADIEGRHHRMFVEPGFAASPEYARFWRDLAVGRFHAAEHKRIGMGGREVWIQATYHPISDLGGKPFKIVKCAIDVTAAKLRQDEAGIRQVIEQHAEAARRRVDPILESVDARDPRRAGAPFSSPPSAREFSFRRRP